MKKIKNLSKQVLIVGLLLGIVLSIQPIIATSSVEIEGKSSDNHIMNTLGSKYLGDPDEYFHAISLNSLAEYRYYCEFNLTGYDEEDISSAKLQFYVVDDVGDTDIRVYAGSTWFPLDTGDWDEGSPMGYASNEGEYYYEGPLWRMERDLSEFIIDYGGADSFIAICLRWDETGDGTSIRSVNNCGDYFPRIILTLYD